MTDMRDFEEYLTGGFEHRKLLTLEHDEDGTQVVMFMMDAEYDPVRITFDPEGLVSIHSDGHMYHMFAPSDLRFIAKKCKEAEKLWGKIFENEPDDDG